MFGPSEITSGKNWHAGLDTGYDGAGFDIRQRTLLVRSPRRMISVQPTLRFPAAPTGPCINGLARRRPRPMVPELLHLDEVQAELRPGDMGTLYARSHVYREKRDGQVGGQVCETTRVGGANRGLAYSLDIGHTGPREQAVAEARKDTRKKKCPDASRHGSPKRRRYRI